MGYMQTRVAIRSRFFMRFGEFFCAVGLCPLGFLFGIIGIFNNKRKERYGLVGWYVFIIFLSVIMTIVWIVILTKNI